MGIFNKVVATITKEECEKFAEVNIKKSAIKELQDNLANQMANVLKENQEIWKEICEKYSIIGGHSLNIETGEIKKN